MKTTMNVYIIEDNLSDLKEIEETIHEFSARSPLINFSIITITNYIEFYKSIDKKVFSSESLFIVDIHLNTFFTGMDIGRKLRKYNNQLTIIFLTYDPSFSIESINSQIKPFSYILKKADTDIFFKEDIESSLKKLEFEKRNLLKTDNSMVVKVGLDNILLNSLDILYISSIKEWRGKVIIKTLHSEMIGNGKLTDFKTTLNPKNFFLAAKSFIINYDLIYSLNRIEGAIIFKNQEKLIVGTSVVEKIKRKLPKMY